MGTKGTSAHAPPLRSNLRKLLHYTPASSLRQRLRLCGGPLPVAALASPLCHRPLARPGSVTSSHSGCPCLCLPAARLSGGFTAPWEPPDQRLAQHHPAV